MNLSPPPPSKTTVLFFGHIAQPYYYTNLEFKISDHKSRQHFIDRFKELSPVADLHFFL